MKKFIALCTACSMLVGSFCFAYGSQQSTQDDLTFIHSHMESVLKGENDFFDSFSQPVVAEKEEYSELDRYLMKIYNITEEDLDKIGQRHAERDRRLKAERLAANPEFLSYDLDKGIKAESVGDSIFEVKDYPAMKKVLENNEKYTWYIPAINNQKEKVTISLAKAGKEEKLKPDAIFSTVDGEEYLNLTLMQDCLKDYQGKETYYLNYFGTILAVASTDKGEFIVPLRCGEMVGMTEEKAYEFTEGLKTINNFISAY